MKSVRCLQPIVSGYALSQAVYDAAMVGLTRWQADAIVAAYDFSAPGTSSRPGRHPRSTPRSFG